MRRDRRSPPRWRSPPFMPSPSWPRPSRAKWWLPPMSANPLAFGPDYLIPKPFDPRLMMKIAPAVAQAAADSGVAQRPVADMDAYRDHLQPFVYASGTTMKPIFTAAEVRSQEARSLLRGRGRARCCAPRRSWSTRSRRAHAHRPPGHHRPAHRANSACASKQGAGLRCGQRGAGPPLPRLLANLPPHDRAQGRDGAHRQDRDAPAPDADRARCCCTRARWTA